MKNSLLIFFLLLCGYSFSQVPKPGQNLVQINEIFADPSPSVDLPVAEFAELWNSGDKNISLKNWVFSDGSTSFKFSNDSIRAGEYLIVCARADTALFKSYGRVIGLSPWPALNNTGDHLTLKNDIGTIISEVNYSDSWYRDAAKKAGGWSLEMIDPQTICSGSQNWTASIDLSGGTPGKQNSVYKPASSTDPLKLISATLTDSVSLLLSFNRILDSTEANKASNYQLNNGVGIPITANILSPDYLSVILKFQNAISRGNTYRIVANNLRDCSGSIISLDFNSLEFTLPKKILKGDILINEILFNPRPDAVDFVEIINHSESKLDLQELFIASIVKDTLSNIRQLSSKQLFLEPGKYLALSVNPDIVKKEYPITDPDAFLRMPSLPSFNDDAGTVVLLSNSIRIDEFSYTEKMHFPLIKDPEGVSLERSSLKRPANDSGNFRSAAGAAGFATPGYKNSQFIEEKNSEEIFSLSSGTFSPDNDGFEDMLQIDYRFDKPGMVANIHIYNDRGMLIRKLSQNLTLSTEGSLNWDGMNDNSELSSVGIYLIYAEFFDAEGNIRKYRKTCVLAKKLQN